VSCLCLLCDRAEWPIISFLELHGGLSFIKTVSYPIKAELEGRIRVRLDF
jgi:hypothetical protein